MEEWLQRLPDWAQIQAFFDFEIPLPGSGHVTLSQILIVPVVVFAGLFLIRLLSRSIARRLQKRNTNPDLIHLIQRVFFVAALAVLFVTTLDLINVPLTAFAFVSGAIAIGVGFGAQNIINNFISGWILMWERPIRIGDFLEVESTRGTVEAINTRSTRIRRVDGVHLLIPNSALLENTVVNWTLVDKRTRTQVRVGVAYGSPVHRVAELIHEAVGKHDVILDAPKPEVVFEDFGDNALVFDVFFWVEAGSEKDLRGIRSAVRFSMHDAFEAEGIVVAFPQRDVHIDGRLNIVSQSAPQAE